MSQMSSIPVRQNLRPKAIRHLLRLYRLKDENLTKFMAIIHNCIQTDFSFGFVWEYCSRGSLAQVIAKKDIKLDWNFKVSLIGDIIRVFFSKQFLNHFGEDSTLVEFSDYCLM